MDALSKKIVNYLINKDVVDSEEIDYYKYGIELTISSVLNIVLILAISLIIFNDIISGILFLIVFITTRQYTGGYHAKTYFMCNLVLSLSYTFLMTFFRFTNYNIKNEILVLLVLLTSLVVFTVSPVKNEHKGEFSKRNYWKFKFFGTSIYILWSIIGIALLTFIKSYYGTILLYTLFLVCFFALFETVKRRITKKITI